jgi:hypothetical protein
MTKKEYTKLDYFWYILFNYIIPTLMVLIVYLNWKRFKAFVFGSLDLSTTIALLLGMGFLVGIQKITADKVGQWHILGAK